MVDRYSLHSSPDSLKKSLGIKETGEYLPTYNAGPTQELPVLLSNQPDTIQLMTWGLISKWSNNKSISPKLFNLPVSHAFEKKMYQKGLKENRCLILADGFFLWKQIGKAKRVPYYFYHANKLPLAIAGLWESFEDLEGNPSNNFIMLTHEASHQIASYQDDMPLILPDPQRKIWLDQESNIIDHQDEIRHPHFEKLKFHSVSPLISNLENNHEGLIKATVPSDQHGNYTLFN